MNRRDFLKMTTYGFVGLSVGIQPKPQKTHIVTLSFDDGFKKSFYKVAEIYEQFHLRACLNVIATSQKAPFGDFDDWNKLKRRGHEVMAHTYDHTDLTKIPLSEAKVHIDKCASYFEAHLDGFKASESVYNFAYNASNPDLDAYALTKFLVVRTQGETAVNPIPTMRKPVRIGCWSHGPDNCDSFFEETIDRFLDSPGGWFVFNTHGLDGEAWGPMSSKYLTSLLSRLSKMNYVDVLPAGEAVLRLPK